MLVWSIALILAISCGIFGFYVGAIRCAITTIALILNLLLLIPLSNLVGKILPNLGISHPGMICVVAPFVVFLLFQILAKAIAHSSQAPIENYYKYKASDTQRMLFERMNQRLGPCVAILNALFYTVFVAIAGLGLGYATVPLSRGGEKDSFLFKSVNLLARGVQSTGMARVASPYVPAAPIYFELVDVIAEWFHQPLVQSGFSTYPPFIPLAEKKEFESMGNDVKLPDFLLKSPSYTDILEHPKLGPIFTDVTFLDTALKSLGGDLSDLSTYIKTGQSPKYDDEKILGRWDFNLPASVGESKKLKRMSALEVNRLSVQLSSLMQDVTLLATVDHKIILRKGSTQTGNFVRREGTWKTDGGGKYQISLPVADDRSLETSGSVEGRRLHLSWTGVRALFDRW